MLNKVLIVVRCGTYGIHQSWVNRISGVVDCAMLYYDRPIDEKIEVKYKRFYEGTKLTGIKNFFDENPFLLEEYDFFWLLDDDLYIPLTTVLSVCNFALKYNIMLCAPALTADSYCNHPVTVQNTALYLRGTDFVECMAPLLRADILKDSLEKFQQYPIFGIERFWQYYLWENKEIAYILDFASITHTREMGKGALYKNNENKFSRPIDDDNLAASVYTSNFSKYVNVLFGIKNNFERDLVFGEDLCELCDIGLSEYYKINGTSKRDLLIESARIRDDKFSKCLSFSGVKNITGLKTINTLESDILLRKWSFGEYGSQPWATKIQLIPTGAILGYKNDNESYWKISNGSVCFFNKENQISTVFSQVKYEVDGFLLTGLHYEDENKMYYLKEFSF